MKNKRFKIVIVGGGSAGWMTATTLLKAKPNCQISLIQSANIPTVGVGESTVEPMFNWCKYIGIEEKDFLKHTDGTPKLSIKFTDFYKFGSEAFHYPFGVADLKDNFYSINDWWYKKLLYPKTPNSDYADCIFPEQMAYVNSNKYSSHLPHAYQFDAIKFGGWLKENKCQKVNHIIDDIKTVEQDENGIVSLNGKYKADLYIDCTGFRSLLLGKTLKEPFESYEDMLPNNSAWATRVPYINKATQVVTYTNCTAIQNGWVWRVPLWSRLGTGYVYSDKFVSDEDALKEFKSHLKNKEKVPNVEKLEYRNIKSRVGIHKRLWVKNVVAIGLSAGFIEPLEGNGLYTVHEFLINLVRNLRRNTFSQWDRDNFTYMCKENFATFAEFVALHYALSHRSETKYWKANFNKQWDEKLINLNPRFAGVMRHLAENRSVDYTFGPEGGSHCIAAGMNWSPTDLDVIKYRNPTIPYDDLKSPWLSAITRLNEKKEDAIKSVEKELTMYQWLKKNIYKGVNK
tara:strand:+ start:400 stop:1938 length:1539 start_codon:yes stop_codon:yes gene_type:complete